VITHILLVCVLSCFDAVGRATESQLILTVVVWPKYPVGITPCLLQKEGLKSYGLSCDDAEDMDDFRLKIKQLTD